MKRIFKIQINRNHEWFNSCSTICDLSRCIFNSALYNFRQQFFDFRDHKIDKTNYGWSYITKKFVSEHNIDYYNLNTKISTATAKQVVDIFSSFFALLKKDKSVKLPRYKKGKNTKYQAILNNQTFLKGPLREGYVQFNKMKNVPGIENIKIRTNGKNVKEVRIVPKRDEFEIVVIYEKEDVKKKKENKRFCSIDLGINNLMTVASNYKTPTLINGKPIKSINQYYNKRKSNLQSKLESGKYVSKQINAISKNRDNKILNYFHLSCNYILDNMIDEKCYTLILGYNEGWKQNANIGKKNNQSFCTIPYFKLKEMLKYKCEDRGITMVETEESYTSKASFLDKDEMSKDVIMSGNRIKRGLYKSKSGIELNADVNGAFNIARKVKGDIKVKKEFILTSPKKCSF